MHSNPIPQLLRTLALLCLTTLCLQAHAAGKRVALVVGNSNYASISNLGNNPRNDADDMARELEGFGFSVTKLKDATRRDLNTALENFGRAASGSEAALFYFAGHGMQIRGDNFLMPVNATAESEAAIRDEGVSLSRVLDEMEGSAAVKIVLIDACRDNPVTGKFRTAQRGLAPPAAPPSGTVIAFAAEPGKTAANTGGNGRNGVFTAGLLTAFKGKDLSLDSVLTVASEEVEANTQRAQTPYVNGPKTLQKRFHFRVQVDPGPAATEAQFWDSIKTSDDAADFEEYKRQYPQGRFVGLADNRIRRLKAANAGGLSGTDVKPPPVTALVAGQAFKDCPDCPEMVVIPGGSFQMGSNDGDANEKPVHSVNVQGFAIGKYEVTQREWKAVMGNNPSHFKDCGDTCPVEQISWDDALEFIKNLNQMTGQQYRLPSEAEWEYACRAGASQTYCGSNNVDRVAVYSYPSGKTQRAGSKQANAWGLYDMSGNVSEWTQDCKNSSYNKAPNDGSAWTSEDCWLRVLRGGSFEYLGDTPRAAIRGLGETSNRNNFIGFRLARIAP